MLNHCCAKKSCLFKEYLRSSEVELICMHVLNDTMCFYNLLVAKVQADCVIQSIILNLSDIFHQTQEDYYF